MNDKIFTLNGDFSQIDYQFFINLNLYTFIKSNKYILIIFNSKIMSFKDKIEKNAVIWLVSVLISGFVSGIGTYKLIMEIASLTTISAEFKMKLMKDNEELKLKIKECHNESKSLRQKIELLIDEKNRLEIEVITISNKNIKSISAINAMQSDKINLEKKNELINKKLSEKESEIKRNEKEIKIIENELEQKKDEFKAKLGLSNLLKLFDNLVKEGKEILEKCKSDKNISEELKNEFDSRDSGYILEKYNNDIWYWRVNAASLLNNIDRELNSNSYKYEDNFYNSYKYESYKTSTFNKLRTLQSNISFLERTKLELS